MNWELSTRYGGQLLAKTRRRSFTTLEEGRAKALLEFLERVNKAQGESMATDLLDGELDLLKEVVPPALEGLPQDLLQMVHVMRERLAGKSVKTDSVETFLSRLNARFKRAV